MESSEQPSEARGDIEPHQKSPGEATPPAAGGVPAWVKIAAVVSLLVGAVGYLIFGSSASDAFVYSKLVNEVMAKPADFKGRELRVEGDLKSGSIKFREDPCEWRFVVQKAGLEMPVEFPQCVVPDTFRDGMGISVVVQGKLNPTGDGFLANQVIPRCPSKYEMQQKKQKGEVMPHAPVVSSATELK